MRFDDRLLTVLNQPADDRHDAAVRWRQLVDLVARAGPHGSSPTVVQALSAIRDESQRVDEPLRSAAARAVAALPLPLGLLEYFASDSLAVSAPVLAAATLDQGQWRALMDIADDETRRFIETLHPELKPAPPLDLTDDLVEAPVEPVPSSPPPPGPSLHEVVARIERRRRMRDRSPSAAGDDALKVAPAGSPALFRWECGPGGEIAWVEGAPRGALIGRSIARGHDGIGDHVDQEVVRAFALRSPFRDASLNLAGSTAVAGEWKISAVPAFDPADGRFAGYRGVALREVATGAIAESAPNLFSDPDSLRELVHEIKTPLNAIIGFAEIIDGQYLGPADSRYRERAREIVRQALLLLGAIDDLDFAAKIHSPASGEQDRIDIGALVESMAPAIRELANERKAEFETSRSTRKLRAPIDPDLARRLIMRTCAAIVEHAGEGERLRLGLDQAGDRCRLSVSRPAALRDGGEDDLFGARERSETGDFGLRLARGLARIAGGDLVTTDGKFALLFPRS